MIKTSKGLVVKGLVIGVTMAFPLMAQASIGGAGMVNGRHDFAVRAMFLTAQTFTSPGGTAGTVNQVGLCTYCHTPHHAQNTRLLWNRAPATQAYTWDEATTAGGTAYPTIQPTYKGPSVKCLSCHDGSVSIGDVGAYFQRPRWGAATLNTFKVGDQDTSAKVSNKIGAGGNMAGNHPIGVPYPYANAYNVYNGIGIGAQVVKEEYVASPILSVPLGNGVKLYNDTGSSITAGAVANLTGIECSSCHDVHNKSSNEDIMLRGKLNGSTQADGYICKQCHNK